MIRQLKRTFSVRHLSRWLIFSLLVFLTAFAVAQDFGLPPYRYYSPQEYLAASRNWSIVTDTSGIVYVANEDGVLRFDGINWDLIELPARQKAYWVEMGEDGYIYVGANGDFGQLIKNDNNQITYQSLAKELPEAYQDFNVVWEVVSTKLGVVFRSRKYLFRYAEGKLTNFSVPGGGRIFDAAYSARDKVYFRVYDLGLAWLNKDGVQVLPNSSFFATKKVNGIYAYGSDQLLIATRFEGLFIYNESGIAPFHSDADEYLRDNKIYDGHQLEDGNYAIATMADGLVVITPSGEQVLRFDSSNGLGNNATLFVTEREGYLWLATKNGLFQIAHQAPYRLVGEEFGLNGQVSDIFQWNEQHYVACNDGFYRLSGEGADRKFKVVNEHTIVDCVNLFAHQDTLHIGSLEGIFRHENGETKRITRFSPREVLATPFDRFYLASEFYFGLYMLRFEGSEIFEERIEGIDRLVTQIKDLGGGRFWVRTIDDQLYDVTIIADNKNVRTFLNWQKQLSADTHIIGINDELRLLTKNKLYLVKNDQVISIGSAISFQYDPEKIIYTHTLNSGNHMICYEDAQGSTFCEKFENDSGGTLKSSGEYLNVDFRPNALFENEVTGEIWLGGADGIRIFSLGNSREDYTSTTALRKLTVADSVISINPDESYEFSYDQNQVTFAYVSDATLKEGKILFQYRLLGGDEAWSEWTDQTQVIYSGLRPNDYEFQVRSKSPYAGTTDFSNVKFRIRRPWFRTYYAYFVYFMLIILAAYGAYRMRVSSLVYNQKKLSRTVANKTRELANAHADMKEKADRLEQLSQFKSRFFSNVSHDLRTPIALLSGRIQLLQSDDQSQFSERANVYLTRLEQDATKLVGLVDDIQELVQMQEGKLTLNIRKIEAEPYFKNISSLFESSCREKGITLMFRATLEAGKEVELDPHYFERISYNLVSNAQKFTRKGGHIELVLDGHDECFEFTVRDTGVGIPDREVKEIFNRSFQANNQLPDHKGLGIGLNVVRELVQLHGGTIQVESEENKGTAFLISIPWEQNNSDH